MKPRDPGRLKPERRHYPRFNVKLPVEFTIFPDERRVYRATVDNISLAGVLLLTEEQLESGSRIVVHIPHDAGSLNIQARVVRASIVGEFGIAFVALNELELERLTSLVDRLT